VADGSGILPLRFRAPSSVIKSGNALVATGLKTSTIGPLAHTNNSRSFKGMGVVVKIGFCLIKSTAVELDVMVKMELLYKHFTKTFE
jgi:hypothetical protein